MKSLTGVLLFLFIALSTFGQVALTSENVNVLYEKVYNPIKIVVEKCDCNKLVVETDNGVLKKYSGCHYELHGMKVGIVHLSIQKMEGKVLHLIGTKTMKVQELPLPTPYVAGLAGGLISKMILVPQLGLIAVMSGFDHSANFKITKFNIEIIRNDSLLFQEEIVGNLFSRQSLEMFKDTISGDILVFNDIYCRYPSGVEKKLQEIKFIILP